MKKENRMRLRLVFGVVIAAACPSAAADDFQFLGPFEAGKVPFVNQEARREIAADYAAAQDKSTFTLAVSKDGGWHSRWSDASSEPTPESHPHWTTESLILNVLQRCEHVAQDACGLAAVEGRLIKFALQPRQLHYATEFDSYHVPFVTQNQLERIYYICGLRVGMYYNAFAVNWDGSWACVYRYRPRTAAVREALRLCREVSEGHGNCFLYAVNGQVVFSPETDIYGDHAL